MRYLVILFFMLGAGFVSRAQVIMNLQIPPAGVVLKDQLWNISLVNSGDPYASVQLEMRLTDIATNQPVVSAVSRIFSMGKGITQIRATDVAPITYTASNSSYPVDNSPNGFLPVGVFNVCFTLIKVDGHGGFQLAEECVTVEVEPISPPMLVFPGDQDRLDAPRPVFTWTPPAPLNLFSNLKYTLSLVEVMPTQSPADAIVTNIPIFISSNVSLTNLQYPAALPSLDTAKIYAWQVRALNNQLPVATSETWTFRVAVDQGNAKGMRNGFYTKLSRRDDGAVVDAYGTLQYQYDNTLNDTLVSVHLYDITKAKKIELPLLASSQAVGFGSNYLAVPMEESASLIDRHVYLFELRNASDERWFAKFAFHKSK